MRKVMSILAFAILFSSVAQAGFFDNLLEKFTPGKERKLNNETVIAGLKEALDVSTEKAVDFLSKPDGFLKNETVKILIPEKIRNITDTMRKFGMGSIVDQFEESMNHAAEKAVPKAIPIFKKAIKDMTFEDAMKILKGGDTAATEYFKAKTSNDLFQAFKPIVSESMNEAGVTNYYKSIMDRAKTLTPLARTEELDLDKYVTKKSLDGLFLMIAEEERNIRKNPAARVTDLLKEVFGSDTVHLENNQ